MHQRKKLEQLYRYESRPTVVGEGLSLTQEVNVRYALSVKRLA